eukprot:231100_1
MDELSICLRKLCQISKIEREKAVKLLCKILNNLLTNLSEIDKYGDLNRDTMQLKFSKCTPALDLLFIAGFEISNDTTRLKWKHKNNFVKLKLLSNVYEALNEQHYLNNPEKLSSNNNNKIEICVIGSNYYGELSMNTKLVTSLTKWNDVNYFVSLKQIKCGRNHTIYYDHSKQSYWLSGLFHGKTIQKCSYMTHFNDTFIKMHKVCVSCNSQKIFWIAETGRVYKEGLNAYSDNYDSTLTIEVGLENVIDIQCSKQNILALCSSSMLPSMISLIINFWCTRKNIHIPHPLYYVIFQYYCNDKKNKIYKQDDVTGCWRETKLQKQFDINIIKIRDIDTHSLYLGSNGSLYRPLYQYQMYMYYNYYSPIKLRKYFSSNIKVVDIECGAKHSLIIDDNGNLYSFGGNSYGECGIGKKGKDIESPTLIETLKQKKMVGIKCGANHSYAFDDQKQHFLWGNNVHNICTLVESLEGTILIPKCINDTFYRLTNGLFVDSVCLGQKTTFIIAMKQ